MAPSTFDIVDPIITKAYGDGQMARSLTVRLVEKIDAWPDATPSYHARTREDMIRLTCWDWFSGGSTAEWVAQKVEAALGSEA